MTLYDYDLNQTTGSSKVWKIDFERHHEHHARELSLMQIQDLTWRNSWIILIDIFVLEQTWTFDIKNVDRPDFFVLTMHDYATSTVLNGKSWTNKFNPLHIRGVLVSGDFVEEEAALGNHSAQSPASVLVASPGHAMVHSKVKCSLCGKQQVLWGLHWGLRQGWAGGTMGLEAM